MPSTCRSPWPTERISYELELFIIARVFSFLFTFCSKSHMKETRRTYTLSHTYTPSHTHTLPYVLKFSYGLMLCVALQLYGPSNVQHLLAPHLVIYHNAGARNEATISHSPETLTSCTRTINWISLKPLRFKA